MKLSPNLTCPPAFLSPASIPGRESCNNFTLQNEKSRLAHVQNDWPSEVSFSTRTHTGTWQ